MSPVRLTHGRHCPCWACAREDWTNPSLAHCGMHGSECPPVYAPFREPMTDPAHPDTDGLRAVLRYYDERVPPDRLPELSAAEWRDAYFALARVALKQLEPLWAATEAAPLDVERLARALVTANGYEFIEDGRREAERIATAYRAAK